MASASGWQGTGIRSSGVAKVLARHGRGRRAQRVAALASLTAAGDGQITDAAMAGPFGFCLFASAPGQVVSLDAFYVGRLKGVGAVWQLTAVDIATRWAVAVVVGDPGLQGSVEQCDGVDAAAVEVRAVELLQDRSVEALADRVVVRGSRWDAVVLDAQGGDVVAERLPGELGPVAVAGEAVAVIVKLTQARVEVFR